MPEGHDPQAVSGAELRGAKRFTLLVRTAKLIVDGREYLCVLRDASATGVKIRLFHPIPEHETLELELGSGDRYPMEMVWSVDDHAGFRFPKEVDVHQLIEDRRNQFPKRQIRLRLDREALLHAHGRIASVILRDISQQGACVECRDHLMLRQSVRLEMQGFPPVYGKVCWRQHPRYGLVFENGFLLEELALHIMKLHASAPAGGGEASRNALGL